MAELVPAATVTDAGTVASDVLPDDSATVVSTAVGPFSVSVPVEVLPGQTVDGDTETEVNCGRSTVTAVLAVAPFSVALMATAVSVATGFPVMVKFAEAAPAEMMTLAGTEADGPLEERTMTVSDGAGRTMVTEADVVEPPVTVAGAALTASGAE